MPAKGQCIPPEIRFWALVQKGQPDECWPWIGYLTRGGYGMFKWSPDENKKPAHRCSWKIEHGEWPGDLGVLHHCDNPPCQNPAHLFLGTHADNMKDCMIKGRRNLARLTKPQVLEIRRLYSEGGYRQKDIAQMFDVSQGNIQAIVTNRSWRYLEELK